MAETANSVAAFAGTIYSTLETGLNIDAAIQAAITPEIQSALDVANACSPWDIMQLICEFINENLIPNYYLLPTK